MTMIAKAEEIIRSAEVGHVDGYCSDNPLTVLGRALRGRTIAISEYEVAIRHQWTEREIKNVVWSLKAAGCDYSETFGI